MKVKTAVTIFTVAMALQISHAEGISFIFASPYVNSETVALFSGIHYEGKNVAAGTFGLKVHYTEQNHVDGALTFVTADPGFFSFRGALLDLPAYQGTVDIPESMIALISTGVSIPVRDIRISGLLTGLFLPKISMPVSTNNGDQSLGMKSAFIPGFTGILKYGNAIFSVTSISGAWYGEVENVEIGNIDGTATLVTGGLKNCGFFFGNVSGSLSMSAVAKLTSSTTLFTGEASGKMDCSAIGGWGKMTIEKGILSASFFAAMGLLMTDNTYFYASYAIDTSDKDTAHYILKWDPSVILLGNASIEYRPTYWVSLSFGRWFWYTSDNIAPLTELEIAQTSVAAATSSRDRSSSIDWQTLLFAGSTISATIHLR
jgi:hypothetical protein